MRNLIPKFILDKSKNKEYRGSMDATAIFLDVSGFTQMTQSLMANGKEGAEILSEVISLVFTPAISIIYQGGGFISTFAGDAFVAIFENNDAKLSLQVAAEIGAFFAKSGVQKTKFGDFVLQVKIGLAKGVARWSILKDGDLSAYYFFGEAIENAAQCEKNAQAGDIIFDRSIAGYIDLKSIKYACLAKRFILKEIEKFPPCFLTKTNINLDSYDNFVPTEIIRQDIHGEFRDVVAIFVSFETNGDYEKHLIELMCYVDEYGGYLNKIDYSDKGGVALVLFGAPISYEQVIQRSLSLAIALIAIEGFEVRIGISYGTVFAGLIGSERRGEYTALGMVVNLAARLMIKAKWGEILTEKVIYSAAKTEFDMNGQGYQSFKGFSDKIAVYSLNGKLGKHKQMFKGEMYGRDGQVGELEKMLQGLHKSESCCIYIDGVAGIGKSHLLSTLKSKSTQYNWLELSCDPILQKSLNPFSNYFYDKFMLDDTDETSTKQKKFLHEYEILVASVDNEFLKKELIRTKSFIAALVDLHFADSLYEKISPVARWENTQLALRNYFLAQGAVQPSIICIENAHNIDAESLAALKFIMRNTAEIPVALISIARYEKSVLPLRLDIDNVRNYSIKLETLSKESSRQMLEDNHYYGKPISDKIFHTIYQKTGGNPYYMEQLFYYIYDSGLITDDDTEIKLPANINELIISKIDRLNTGLKSVTKTASVLGDRFSENILIAMEPQAKAMLAMGEQEDLWQLTDGQKYSFSNKLLRDGAYGLILKKSLSKLHKKAAKAIEMVYVNNLDNYCEDLAYNYDRADESVEAVYWLERAARQAKSSYRNRQAMLFYKRLIERSRQLESMDKVYEARFELIEILLIMGEVDNAELEMAEFEADEKFRDEYTEELLYLRARLMHTKEDYMGIMKYVPMIRNEIKTKKYLFNLEIYYLDALRFLSENDDFLANTNNFLQLMREEGNQEFESQAAAILGTFYLQTSKFDKAAEQFENCLKIARMWGDMEMEQKSLHNLGVIQSHYEDKKVVLEYYQKAFSIAEELGNQRALSKILNDMANIYNGQGDYAKSIRMYERGLDISRTMGNRLQEATAIYNIADALYRDGKNEKSIDLLKKSRDISLAINDNVGIAYANDLYGDILFTTGEYDKARMIYNENLHLFKSIGDTVGIAHTYGNLGNLAKIAEDYNQAAVYYASQQQMLAEVGDQDGEGRAWFNWAMIELDQKNYAISRKYLQYALVLFEKSDFKMGLELAKQQMEILNNLLPEE